MRVYKDEEMRWSMLRYDSRTFTAQQAKMLKGDVTRKEIPEKYIYIDDGCFNTTISLSRSAGFFLPSGTIRYCLSSCTSSNLYPSL